MNDAGNSLEPRLAKAYEAQVLHYDGALRAMQQHLSAAPCDLENPAWFEPLQAALQQVAAIDAAMRADRLAWQQSGQRPGHALRAALDQVAQRIRLLGAQVDRCIAELSEKRRRLMPTLDGFLRQRRMLHAYDQFKSLEKSARPHVLGG